MEFGFSDVQRDLHARMRELGSRAEAAPPAERLSLLAGAGVLGLSVPRDFGGGGLDLVSTALAFEGLGGTLKDGGVLLAAGAHLFGVAMMIARIGTPEQKARWLPKLATGEIVATVCATEEATGSDVGAAQSIAEPAAGGAFRLTGKKRYVTAAARAGLYFVIARHGAQGRGLCALLVPRGEGIHAGPPLDTAGLRGAELAPVTFEGVTAEAGALVGRAGAGLAAFQVAMTFERALILAFRLGAMDAELSSSVAFARQRRLGDTPIAKHQAVAHRLARMKMRLETSRLLTYRAAWALDRGERAQSEAALAKWHVADAATHSALDALKLRGGAGFLTETGLVQDLADAIGGTAHSGTEDVLANIVAAWMGL